MIPSLGHSEAVSHGSSALKELTRVVQSEPIMLSPPLAPKSLIQTFPAKFHFASEGVTGVKVWTNTGAY